MCPESVITMLPDLNWSVGLEVTIPNLGKQLHIRCICLLSTLTLTDMWKSEQML
jgi:hypothetical protein